jgi:purine nucleosidase/pyrimidine-specific ribonucleoside hydrolase
LADQLGPKPGPLPGLFSAGYGRYCAYIDATAVALLLNPTMLSTREVGVDVETVSPLTLGMTVVERRVHHAWTNLPRINVAYDADFSAFREFIVETLPG